MYINKPTPKQTNNYVYMYMYVIYVSKASVHLSATSLPSLALSKLYTGLVQKPRQADLAEESPTTTGRSVVERSSHAPHREEDKKEAHRPWSFCRGSPGGLYMRCMQR